MEEVHDSQLKRERPSPYGRPPPPGIHHMPSTEAPGLHGYHHPPPPGAQMPPQWNPTPSPYHESADHRPPPPPSDHPSHPQPYSGQHYPPPPPGHVVDPSYNRHESAGAPTRSPPSAQPPQYPPPPVNGNGPEHQYYQQPPPDYRARPPYGPPEGQPNGVHPPPLHVTTTHEIMPGQPQSASALNTGTPFSAGPTHMSAYPWPGYDVYPRRKPVRAAQACDPCRQRKAKCDEGRPQCTHCKDNQLTCVYRDVPPQKSEKQVLAITDELKSLSGNVERMMDQWKAQDEKMNCMFAILQDQQAALTKLTGAESPDNDKSALDDAVRKPRPSKAAKQEHRSESAHQIFEQSFTSITTTATEKPHDTGAKESTMVKSTTAAANLLSWPAIKQLIPRDLTTSYVMDTESERGLLRLYGCGEGEDRVDGDSGLISPSASSNSSRTRPTPDQDLAGNVSNGAWGIGHFPAPSNTSNSIGLQRENVGGLAAHGGLNLDCHIVDKYYRSYLQHIYILHPFLDTRVLKKMVQKFQQKYSWDFLHSQRIVSGVGAKRKRETSDSPNSVEDFPITAVPHRLPASRNVLHPGMHAPIEHSTANAIVLLVLALGKICAHQDPLPGPAPTPSMATSTQHTIYSDLPMSASAPTSPYAGPNQSNTSGASLVPGPSNPQGKNMDVIPGLAYFTKAADILGEMPGGVGVSYIQANLLAGLYMGQLARIFASHWYIRNACVACQVLLESTTYRENQMSEARRNLINTAFWSCLQLESDILAEMQIPASGIVSKEAGMLNVQLQALTLGDPDVGDQAWALDVHRHYANQIQLRRTLNDAKGFLYSEEKREQDVWPKTLIDVLSENLENWRHLLNDWAWDDDDHQSSDINMARLRGKYYGAKYMIHRPALYFALHRMAAYTPAGRLSESPAAGFGSDYSSSPAIQGHYPGFPAASRKAHDIRPPPSRSYEPLEPLLKQYSQHCVSAAIRSTTAFDKVPPRLIITNVFGTAHAQFGNVLVLSAVYMSPHPEIRGMINDKEYKSLLERTIAFLRRREPISPTLGVDARILQHVHTKLFPKFQPDSAASSFSSR